MELRRADCGERSETRFDAEIRRDLAAEIDLERHELWWRLEVDLSPFLLGDCGSSSNLDSGDFIERVTITR